MSEFSVRYSNVNVGDIIGRLIRNPSYGGPRVGLNGWCWRNQISNHTKAGFQEALEASIAEEGVRNPILVWALPEGMLLTFGGSRLKAARVIGLTKVPAIINDYTGAYSGCPEVHEANWDTFFQDPPRVFEFTENGADYHYNLERARRHEHDPAGFAWLKDEQPEFISKEFPWLISDKQDV